MKRIITLVLCLFATCINVCVAQMIIKQGSILSVQCNKEIRAKKVNPGDMVEFEINEEFKIKDQVAIAKGSKVYARILEAKKSGIAGTKGKLKIEFVYCQVGDKKVPLDGNVDFCKKNHTSGAVVAAAVVALPLICLTGQHAAIPAGYQTVVTVKADTEL